MQPITGTHEEAHIPLFWRYRGYGEARAESPCGTLTASRAGREWQVQVPGRGERRVSGLPRVWSERWLEAQAFFASGSA